MKPIPTAGPSITQKEIDYVLDAVTHGWSEQRDGYLKRFERAFAEYIGTRFALSTSSCTGALHLALAGLGIGKGDEVLVPEITWVATASAVTYVGAKPVFVDVDPETWCMDPDSARRAISHCTKAILPVHLYGHPADMIALTQLARQYGLHIIEDAAPALGAEVHGRRVGGLSDVAVFSFQGAKVMTTGEGGMLVTDNEDLYERVRHLADHGRDSRRGGQVTAVGYKYKLSNVQAALGLAQLERIVELLEKKRTIFGWYQRRLAGVPGLHLNVERLWARNIFWMTSVVFAEGYPAGRDAVAAALKQRGIDTRPFFPPLSSLPMFHSCELYNPAAYRVARHGLNLPSGHDLTEVDVDRVCGALTEMMRALARMAA